MSEVKDNEKVYDEQIAPEMERICKLCLSVGIPMIAVFQLTPGSQTPTNPRGGLMATTRVGIPGEVGAFRVAETVFETDEPITVIVGDQKYESAKTPRGPVN